MAKTKITSTKTNETKKAHAANIGLRGFNLLDEEDIKELLGEDLPENTLDKED